MLKSPKPPTQNNYLVLNEVQYLIRGLHWRFSKLDVDSFYVNIGSSNLEIPHAFYEYMYVDCSSL